MTDGLFPFQQQVSYASELMLLQMPRETAAARYAALLQCSAHAYPACQAASALVRSALQAAYEAAVHLSEAQRERLCHPLFALASLLPEGHAAPAGGDHDRQRAALTEIEEHLGEHALSAQFLAARVGLSRRRLDEIFVKHFGRPVTAYIWERRLERARDMLHDDCHAGQTITHIALSVGFEDASHFSRVFKNRFGTAPSIWRSRSVADLITPVAFRPPAPSWRLIPMPRRRSLTVPISASSPIGLSVCRYWSTPSRRRKGSTHFSRRCGRR